MYIFALDSSLPFPSLPFSSLSFDSKRTGIVRDMVLKGKESCEKGGDLKRLLPLFNSIRAKSA